MESLAIIHVLWAWVCVGNVVYFIIRWNLYIQKPGLPDDEMSGCVAVIESVKGKEINYPCHVRSLIHQDHPCYRVIFCLNDKEDSAFQFLAAFFHLERQAPVTYYHLPKQRLLELNLESPGLQSVDIVLAGKARTCSQKIFNQIRGYGLLQPDDRILVWVDADAGLTETWLRDLIRPIIGKSLAATTGYRCLIPRGNDWTSSLISVINSSILTLLGDPWRNSLWGGSMAMTRQVFDRCRIPDYLKKSFSDDVAMAALLKKKRIPIYFSYGVIPRDSVRYSFSQMFSFARRQYFYSRFYFKFQTFISGVLLTGSVVMFFLILGNCIVQPRGLYGFLFPALIISVFIRGLIRFWFIRRKLAVAEYGIKCLFLETAGTPLVNLLHLSIWIAALVGNTVEWAGTTYKVKAPFDVEIL